VERADSSSDISVYLWQHCFAAPSSWGRPGGLRKGKLRFFSVLPANMAGMQTQIPLAGLSFLFCGRYRFFYLDRFLFMMLPHPALRKEALRRFAIDALSNFVSDFGLAKIVRGVQLSVVRWRHMNARIILLLGLSSLLISGCATTSHKISGNSPEYHKAVEVFGGRQNLFFLQVTSDGPLTDTIVSGLTAAHPSAMSKQIGKVIGLAQDRKVDFAVMGDSPMLTKITVIKGLEIQKGKSLPNLRVLYIGEESNREDVQKAVNDLGAEFFFIEKGTL
jgi:hypothetical protein